MKKMSYEADDLHLFWAKKQIFHKLNYALKQKASFRKVFSFDQLMKRMQYKIKLFDHTS